MKWSEAIEEHLQWEEREILPLLQPEDAFWMVTQHTELRRFNYNKEMVAMHASHEQQRLIGKLPAELALHMTLDHLELEDLANADRAA